MQCNRPGTKSVVRQYTIFLVQDARGPRDDVILEEDEEEDNFESADFKPKQKPTYEKYDLDDEDDFKPVNRPKPKIELPDIGKLDK